MNQKEIEFDLETLMKTASEGEMSYQNFLSIVGGIVLEKFNLSMNDLLSKKRDREIVEKRYMIFVKAREVFGERISFKEIARPFSKLHAIVHHAIETHRDTLMKRKSYRKDYILFSKIVDSKISVSSVRFSSKRAIDLLNDLKDNPPFYERGVSDLISKIEEEALYSHPVDVKNLYNKLVGLKNAQQ